MVQARYSFGDSDLAAERLELLGAHFAGTTRALLARAAAAARAPVHRIADLGCGPGGTTALLRDSFPAARIDGVDASRAFLAHARARVPDAEFHIGDVTAPLAGAPYDLVYARFLLSHLPDVEAAIHGWCAALAPGGMVVLEEPESIASHDADCARYEQVSSALVRARGGVFYAGPLIAGARLPTGVARAIDEAAEIDLTAGQAASMFWRNAAVWRDDAIAAGLIDATELDALIERLRAREHDGTRGLFAWRQRQTVLLVLPDTG